MSASAPAGFTLLCSSWLLVARVAAPGWVYLAVLVVALPGWRSARPYRLLATAAGIIHSAR